MLRRTGRTHNRRIGGEAADLNLRDSREGPQESTTATRRRQWEGGDRSSSRPCGTTTRKNMLVSPQMDAASAGSKRQARGGMQRHWGDVVFPFWAALHLS